MTKQKNKILFKICFVFLFSSSSILLALPVEAAGLIFGTHSKEIGLGKNFETGVFLNSEGQSINAVEGKIIFPAGSLELQDIRDSNSILNLWIEKPHLQKSGEVVFSGIIPGGYIGNRGYLFSLILRATKQVEITITTTDERILLNDGQGSKAPLKRAPLSLKVVAKTETGEFLPPYDSDPPEPFVLSIAQNPTIFDNRYFLVFTAQDKGSGIDHYEVQETRDKKPREKRWITGESPYLLKDQNLRSYIFVKAIDKARNERLAVLPPQKPLAWYENYRILIIIIVIALIYIISRRYLWRQARQITQRSK